MSDGTELYEILEYVGDYCEADAGQVSDLSRMIRSYARNVWRYRDNSLERMAAENIALKAEIERLSPPLAPVLEWRECSDFPRPHFCTHEWDIYGTREEKFALFYHGHELAQRDTLEKAQLLASSIQRLLDETL